MEIIEIESDIFLFQFAPEGNKIVGSNIFAIIDNDKALLIDTGYEKHMEQVTNELVKRKVKVSIVIISHFHPDHFLGLKLIDNKLIIGSRNYKDTILRFIDEDEAFLYFPDIEVKKSHKINFGYHEIEMLENPGHSRCTIITQVDKKYTHVGDEIIFTNDGRPVLPFVSLKDNQDHVESLKRILSIKNNIVFPGHGSILRDSDALNIDIKNRINYLDKIYEKSGNIKYDDAALGNYEFMNSGWHEYNSK